MVDRPIRSRLLDFLRENNFSTAKQIANKTGLDLETVKAGLLELAKDKIIFRHRP